MYCFRCNIGTPHFTLTLSGGGEGEEGGGGGGVELVAYRPEDQIHSCHSKNILPYDVQTLGVYVFIVDTCFDKIVKNLINQVRCLKKLENEKSFSPRKSPKFTGESWVGEYDS